MTTLAQVVLLLTLLAEPLLALAVDLRPHLRAPRRAVGHGREAADDPRAAADLTVVVPLDGDVRELDRLAWLHDEGARVLLVTTGAQGPAFHRRLWAVAGEHGFRVHVAGTRRQPGAAQRARPGRTALLGDAHATLTSTYVVCVDPGTVISSPLRQVVGALAAAGLDVGTVTTAVAPHGLLARVQRVEDELAGRLRHRVPWLVRGGVHVARRAAHADLLRRHTRFGAGDDAELGVLGVARGLRVGHLDVAATGRGARSARDWWAERLTEVAGVVRLSLLHPHLGVRRPSLHLLPAAGAFALVPLLWWSVLHVPWVLVLVVVAHGALTAALTRGLRDPVAWLYPLYAVVRAFVLLPLGVLAYVVAAVRAGDAGTLRVRDPWWSADPADAPVVRRLPGPGPARATDWWAGRR
ncbi:hypothetical protein H9657_09945 [Cellulomonas sp. Sa3CUA2]|uniref:Glycosyltransferase 2-like domain-containing protein n=1 Tax=Cellulomonas avistercoris TaxID=2762242 RepID=A0ABR8QE71_9CELL|nr:hypothetical protein [Cellulomonas avistercoris]MBD7918594.1 hypothetical protein [Cellulomonas avistercoris]